MADVHALTKAGAREARKIWAGGKRPGDFFVSPVSFLLRATPDLLSGAYTSFVVFHVNVNTKPKQDSGKPEELGSGPGDFLFSPDLLPPASYS